MGVSYCGLPETQITAFLSLVSCRYSAITHLPFVCKVEGVSELEGTIRGGGGLAEGFLAKGKFRELMK
jgi:hypothetical protein